MSYGNDEDINTLDLGNRATPEPIQHPMNPNPAPISTTSPTPPALPIPPISPAPGPQIPVGFIPPTPTQSTPTQYPEQAPPAGQPESQPIPQPMPQPEPISNPGEFNAPNMILPPQEFKRPTSGFVAGPLAQEHAEKLRNNSMGPQIKRSNNLPIDIENAGFITKIMYKIGIINSQESANKIQLFVTVLFLAASAYFFFIF